MAKSYAHAPAVGRPDGGEAKGAPRVMTEREVMALAEENRRLRAMVARLDAENLFRRVDFLFRVVASPEAFGPAFVARCAAEIEAALTVPEAPAEAPETQGKPEAAGNGGGE